MINTVDRRAQEKAEQEAAEQKQQQAEIAQIVQGLRQALEGDEQLLAFSRGRIAGGWRGKLNIGPEAFFAPIVNIGLTERRLLLQHIHPDGSPSEIVPHSFALTEIEALSFADIETFGRDMACRLILRLTGDRHFRLRLAGKHHFDNAKTLNEVFQALVMAQRPKAPTTQLLCSCGKYTLDKAYKFCPFCGLKQPEAAAPADAVATTAPLAETPPPPAAPEPPPVPTEAVLPPDEPVQASLVTPVEEPIETPIEALIAELEEAPVVAPVAESEEAPSLAPAVEWAEPAEPSLAPVLAEATEESPVAEAAPAIVETIPETPPVAESPVEAVATAEANIAPVVEETMSAEIPAPPVGEAFPTPPETSFMASETVVSPPSETPVEPPVAEIPPIVATAFAPAIPDALAPPSNLSMPSLVESREPEHPKAVATPPAEEAPDAENWAARWRWQSWYTPLPNTAETESEIGPETPNTPEAGVQVFGYSGIQEAPTPDTRISEHPTPNAQPPTPNAQHPTPPESDATQELGPLPDEIVERWHSHNESASESMYGENV